MRDDRPALERAARRDLDRDGRDRAVGHRQEDEVGAHRGEARVADDLPAADHPRGRARRLERAARDRDDLVLGAAQEHAERGPEHAGADDRDLQGGSRGGPRGEEGDGSESAGGYGRRKVRGPTSRGAPRAGAVSPPGRRDGRTPSPTRAPSRPRGRGGRTPWRRGRPREGPSRGRAGRRSTRRARTPVRAWGVSMRGRVKETTPSSVASTSVAGPCAWPPFSSTARHASIERSVAAASSASPERRVPRGTPPPRRGWG